MKVIFFPPNEIPVKVCNHRYGAKMTYSEQTDSIYESSRYAVEYYAHKFSAAVGAFIDQHHGQLTELESSQKYGACKFDIYFPTNYWFNPTTKIIETIPDFESTTWSQKGIDTFGYDDNGVIKINGVAVSIGSSKTSRTPSHGAQMYNFSNGKYGWNNGTFGESKGIELLNVIKDTIDWYKGVFDKYPTAMSYRVGSSGGASMDIIAFLQARNSGYTIAGSEAVAETWYGRDSDNNYLGYPQKEVSRNDLSSRPSSSRWYDSVYSNGKTKAESLQSISNLITLTLANGGWVNNFTHWHNLQSQTDADMKLHAYDDYFNAITQAAGNNYIHFCSYGEASEYLIYRCCIDNVAAYKKGNRIAVALSIIDGFKDSVLTGSGLDAKLPINRIKTPVSVEVDLTGTFLEGKNVKTTYGKAINVGNNKVIIEIPFPTNNEGVAEIEIFDNILPDWKTTNKPVISNFTENEGEISFTTDCLCYSCVFEITDSDNISLVQRNIDSLKTSHSFSYAKSEDKSYAVGVINECGITSLKTID